MRHRVDDAPFWPSAECRGEGKSQAFFETNVDDDVTVNTDILRFEHRGRNFGLKPYVLVRARLEALCHAPCFMISSPRHG